MTTQSIGPYQVLEEIASGAQATVYRVRDTRTGRIVALKAMHPHLARDSDFVQRFRREARIAEHLDHPNIVRIYEAGEDGRISFIAMEFYPMSLHQLAADQGALPVERALDITHQIALALDHAHTRDVIHRDIKPQNVLIAPDGAPKVADFGIARAADSLNLTRTGMVMGSPQYMAPEQGRGETADARSDIYSLGILAYQLLTGRVPYQGDTPWAVLRQHMEAPVPSVQAARMDVPSNVDRIVRRALAKRPEERFQTAGQMAQAIEEATPRPAEERSFRQESQAPPISPSPPPESPPIPLPTKREPPSRQSEPVSKIRERSAVVVTTAPTARRDQARQAIAAQPAGVVTVLSSLLAAQDQLRYLPPEAIDETAQRTGASITEVWGVASFYPNFRFTPPGRHTVEVCWGPTCHVLGAQPLLRGVMDRLGLDGEGDTPDGAFTLRLNTCLGVCPHGPATSFDHQVAGRTTLETAVRRIDLLAAGDVEVRRNAALEANASSARAEREARTAAPEADAPEDGRG